MKGLLTTLAMFCFSLSLAAQTNILSTNAIAEQVMKGNYDVATYSASTILNHPDDIIPGIQQAISADSLKAYIIKLSTFKNRNTGADTTSLTTGMGASRRWVHQKFTEISTDNENRLLPAYLQFDQDICGMGQHRNIFAVLPGMDPNDHSVVLIEGHIDSRCEGLCDIECDAEGVEDNASGTALVIELARVMSQYSYSKTLVFVATIGEEQGLYGADAFAKYAVQEAIDIKAVLNNDVIGGVICGATASEPSCPGENHIDSLQVRLFSAGAGNSQHKSLARFSKLEYTEELLPIVPVPMMMTIMSAEDRTGRGGDHIPFRQQGYTAIRYTSANEHGNADVSDPDYHDRQHTMEDILGVDTDGDMIIDSFCVDFNYLARNAVINGVTAGMAAIGPATPDFSVVYEEGFAKISIQDPIGYDHYRIGVRRYSNDFDTLITIVDDTEYDYAFSLVGPYYFSMMSVDTNGIESLFSREDFTITTLVDTEEPELTESSKKIELLQNRPNPFDESTYIAFMVNEPITYQEAFIKVRDLNGKDIRQIAILVKEGMNEILYEHGYGVVGTFVYSLEIDGEVIDSRKMVFAN